MPRCRYCLFFFFGHSVFRHHFLLTAALVQSWTILVQNSTQLYPSLVYVMRFKQISISCWEHLEHLTGCSESEWRRVHWFPHKHLLRWKQHNRSGWNHILTFCFTNTNKLIISFDFQLQSAAWIFSRVRIKQEKEASPTPVRMIAAVFDVWQARAWAACFLHSPGCASQRVAQPWDKFDVTQDVRGGDRQRRVGRGSMASFVDAFLIFKNHKEHVLMQIIWITLQ